MFACYLTLEKAGSVLLVRYRLAYVLPASLGYLLPGSSSVTDAIWLLHKCRHWFALTHKCELGTAVGGWLTDWWSAPAAVSYCVQVLTQSMKQPFWNRRGPCESLQSKRSQTLKIDGRVSLPLKDNCIWAIVTHYHLLPVKKLYWRVRRRLIGGSRFRTQNTDVITYGFVFTQHLVFNLFIPTFHELVCKQIFF